MRKLAALAAINFIVFVAIALYLGGDALNGHVQDGHYFLGLHSNGPFTEVSRKIFAYSAWHAMSVIISLGLLVIVESWRRLGPKGR